MPNETKKLPPGLTPPSAEVEVVMQDVSDEAEKRREHVCDCGESFIQYRLGDKWLPSTCPYCANSERRLTADEVMADRRRRDEEERQRQRVARLQVPRMYAIASTDDLTELAGLAPDEKAAQLLIRKRDLARRYIDAWPDRHTNPRFPLIVVMRGAPGSGKTTLAWAVTLELVRRHGIHARVATLGNIIRDLREPWGRRGTDAGPSERVRLAAYHGEDLLVIDEVSTHALYGEPRQVLYDLIAPREANLSPTILTTNDDGGTIEDLLGPALVSRAMRSGGIWEFGKHDYRPQLYERDHRNAAGVRQREATSDE